MRKDYFLIGLGVRLLMLLIFIYVNEDEVYNDASEIIYQALQELLGGRNPYSKSEYFLAWGNSQFSQPFNYGPVTLLVYLPAMLIPIWYNNLWIGMAIMINVYSFLIGEFVSKIGSCDRKCQKNAQISHIEKDPRENQLLYYGGIFFWIIPVGTTCITVFIYAPILLTVLAFDKLKNPILSSLCITLAAMSYQLIYLFVPIYVVYHMKRGLKDFGFFILGALPAIFIGLIFIFWPSGGFIESLFTYSSNMPYNKCPSCGNNFDSWSVFSIPRILFNISDGSIQIGPEARFFMFFILGVICVVYLFTKRFDSYEEWFLIKYFILSVILFTLTTNYGQSHYLIFLFIPLLYYFQMKKPDFHKQYPIGAGMWSWDDFDKYYSKYHKVAL
ncbi:hypothetical protein [Candidatus Lokiarchaeum ossiferum]|uniref:hypothetical protein n=1 Tax=Candidatus Lokiarchaeum ossiferum TaxID=2951803 RepID=UPI00352D571E